MSVKQLLPRLKSVLSHKSTFTPILNTFLLRNSSYQNSKPVGNIEEYNSKFEITKNPEDWMYVERVLPVLTVPTPKLKSEYNSTWKPQAESVVNETYFIERNKNFMIPVYLHTTHRGMRKITKIRRIQGDIFQLEKDLKSYLEENSKKEVATQVNELVGYIHIKGDYVNMVKDYLMKKGF